MSQSSALLSLEAHFDFVCLFNNYIANMADQIQLIKKFLSLTVFYKNYPINRYVNQQDHFVLSCFLYYIKKHGRYGNVGNLLWTKVFINRPLNIYRPKIVYGK